MKRKILFMAAAILCTAPVYAQEEELIDEDEELVFDDVDNAEGDIEDTGMMGTTEGTYADSEEVYVLDDETAYTNEVEISPSWCE